MPHAMASHDPSLLDPCDQALLELPENGLGRAAKRLLAPTVRHLLGMPEHRHVLHCIFPGCLLCCIPACARQAHVFVRESTFHLRSITTSLPAESATGTTRTTISSHRTESEPFSILPILHTHTHTHIPQVDVRKQPMQSCI